MFLPKWAFIRNCKNWYLVNVKQKHFGENKHIFAQKHLQQIYKFLY